MFFWKFQRCGAQLDGQTGCLRLPTTQTVTSLSVTEVSKGPAVKTQGVISSLRMCLRNWTILVSIGSTLIFISAGIVLFSWSAVQARNHLSIFRPGEFFHDEKTGKLYLYYNGTGVPPASTTVVAPQQQVLVNMTGTQWDPVKDVRLSGVTYTAASYTYMNPHGVPSAGDWALERYSAVFLQGTEGALIDGCTFDRLDGNGVMISGYNRYATVQHSDFSYMGGNAIASWGFTNETDTDPGRPGVAILNAPQAGVDGTDGEHPRYNQVRYNYASICGSWDRAREGRLSP